MSTQVTEKRIYKSVDAYGSDTLDYVVPNGKTLALSEIGINSSPDIVDTYVQIVWDPSGANEFILVGYSDSVQKCTLKLLGDGSKIMRINLVNNDTVARYMGGYYIGELE